MVTKSEAGPGRGAWTVEQVRRDLSGLLAAADEEPQKILTATRLYTVTSTRLDKTDTHELLKRGGPLDDDD